jgi:hypothetical protein
LSSTGIALPARAERVGAEFIPDVFISAQIPSWATARLGAWISYAEEDHKMKAGYRHLSFLVLTAALIAPAAITTSAAAQDNKRQEDNQRNDKKQTRVYDRSHKDYHDWNENEDRSYRQYLGEQHKTYRDYSKQNSKQQGKYWNWRHSHPDNK